MTTGVHSESNFIGLTVAATSKRLTSGRMLDMLVRVVAGWNLAEKGPFASTMMRCWEAPRKPTPRQREAFASGRGEVSSGFFGVDH